MAKFVQKGNSIDYIPASAVEAGEIVTVGGLFGVAERPIASSALGALTIKGVFEVDKVESAVVSAGADIYLGSDGKATPTSTSTVQGKLGLAVAAAGSGAATVDVLIG